MALAYCCIILSVIVTVVVLQEESPYLQVYPNNTDGRKPLHFALMLSFGGDYTSIGALPGVQIALDYINNEPSILPGYSLHYTLSDSQCNRSVALESLFSQISHDPIKLGLVGSGCSVATEPTAEITQFFNIPQVSCISSSSELKNRGIFRYYFQLLEEESKIAQGFFKIIRYFGWKRITIIAQNENLFTLTMDALKVQLAEIGVTFTEKLFKSKDGIGGLSGQIFDPDIRIYVVAMYSSHARDLFCKAYEEGVSYPKHMLITYGWYGSEWWKASSEFNCTAEQRASVLPYTLAPRIQDGYTNLTARDVSGINAVEFMLRYQQIVGEDFNKDINLAEFIPDLSEPFYYAQHCHEATLAYAFALNKTIAELDINEELNSNAALFAYIPNGTEFTMENFHYNNSVIVEEMTRHLQNSSFPGLSGHPVSFDEDGIREVDVLEVHQYRWDLSDPSNLILITVGRIETDIEDIIIEYMPQFSAYESGMWPDDIPNDGIPIDDVVTVSLALTVLYVIFAVAGIVFAVICPLFTLIFRNKKLIRRSSPNLNYIIGLGAIILYLNVIAFVIPTTDPDFVSVLCNINPWLTSIGYSLCYGTILIKMVRVWIIFSNPFGLKTPLLKDYALTLFVLCLVVIDVFILGIYTVTEGLKGNLGVKLTPNREMNEETIGPTEEIHQYFLYVCESDGQDALYAVLYGYKGLLTLFALLLAFRTRKVKVKGLDDSKYIAASIYVTSIVLAVSIVSTYTLMDYVNAYPAVVGMGFLLGTTMILALVFIPRMVGLYQDPEGKNIRLQTTVSDQNGDVVELRRRIGELERNLKQQISTSVTLCPPSDTEPPPMKDEQWMNST